MAVSGTVTNDLFDAVRATGEGAQLAADVASLLAWQLDLGSDAAPGDAFRLLVEKRFLGDRFHRYGRLLAVEYRGRAAGSVRAFLVDPERHADPPRFCDERGEPLDKSLLRSPLRPTPLTATGDRSRARPVLHRERGQLGIDYPAATGAPVWAVAAGTVSFIGVREAGGGASIALSHDGGLETVYLHLGRTARGLAVGSAVRQRQVIGYVGTANGGAAHLHFGVKIGGHFVDALRIRPARGAPLPPGQREAFLASAPARLAELARIPIPAAATGARPRPPTPEP